MLWWKCLWPPWRKVCVLKPERARCLTFLPSVATATRPPPTKSSLPEVDILEGKHQKQFHGWIIMGSHSSNKRWAIHQRREDKDDVTWRHFPRPLGLWMNRSYFNSLISPLSVFPSGPKTAIFHSVVSGPKTAQILGGSCRMGKPISSCHLGLLKSSTELPKLNIYLRLNECNI